MQQQNDDSLDPFYYRENPNCCCVKIPDYLRLFRFLVGALALGSGAGSGSGLGSGFEAETMYSEEENVPTSGRDKKSTTHLGST